MEAVTYLDLQRIADTIRRQQIGMLHVSVIAFAERMDIVQVLTMGYRDFGTVRPRHHTGLEILP